MGIESTSLCFFTVWVSNSILQASNAILRAFNAIFRVSNAILWVSDAILRVSYPILWASYAILWISNQPLDHRLRKVAEAYTELKMTGDFDAVEAEASKLAHMRVNEVPIR